MEDKVKIVLVRHGEQDVDSGALSSKGRQQIIDAAGKIRKLLPHADDAIVISSPVLRAKQSAEILAEHVLIPEFGPLRIEVEEGLSDGSRAPLDAVEALIQSHSGALEILIVVSHQSEVTDLVCILSERILGRMVCIVPKEGDVILVDLEEKEVRKL